MESLHSIGCRHGTDKAFHHHYMDFYEKYLSPLRKESFNLLEIGILQCKSLRTWLEYFPYAKIMGMDILDYPNLCERNINYRISQDDTKISSMFVNNFFKVIIDDGSHIISHQIKSLGLLWDKLQAGGIYICEDIHTSFCTRIGNEFHDFKPTTFEVLKKIENKEASGFYCNELYINLDKISTEIQNIEFFIKDSKNLEDSQTCVLVKKN